jgi:prepilin-type N-terminal cleavage/methylation domain-containing protein
MKRPLKTRGAFSLLELLAVITILGIIALVVIPRIATSSATAKENACFQNKAEINSAVERFFFDTGALPANIANVNSSNYFPDGIPVCPVSGAAYALDATSKRVTGHTAGSH